VAGEIVLLVVVAETDRHDGQAGVTFAFASLVSDSLVTRARSRYHILSPIRSNDLCYWSRLAGRVLNWPAVTAGSAEGAWADDFRDLVPSGPEQ
jgi:hypothetical protein